MYKIWRTFTFPSLNPTLKPYCVYSWSSCVMSQWRIAYNSDNAGIVSSMPIFWKLCIVQDHPVESCNAYRSNLTKSGELSDNFCRCLRYWETAVMSQRPLDYTAHGAYYTPTPSNNACCSYIVSRTPFPSSRVKLIRFVFVTGDITSRLSYDSADPKFI